MATTPTPSAKLLTTACLFAVTTVAIASSIAPFASAQAPKSVLVLSLRSATQAQRCSNATLSAEVFTDANSVQAYFLENSYGLASISGTVSGPYTISVGNYCSLTNWANQADSAATAAGVNLSAYDVKAYVLPPECTALCPGKAGYAGYQNGGRVWVREDACDSKMVFAHELGHVFGAGHSGTPGFEYGDHSSVMCGIFDGLADQQTYLAMFNATPHFTAPQKIYEGWLPAGNVQAVTVGGSYKVALLKNALTDVQALKIFDGTCTYFLSYRRAVGFDSSLLTQYVDKTSVHSANSGASTLQAILGDGQSFSNGKFTVTQTSHDATFAYITVSFDTTTTPRAGRARAPQPKVREIATIPGVAVDEAVRLPNGRVVLYTEGDSIVAYDLTTKHGTVITGGFDGQLTASSSGDRIAFDRQSEDERTYFIVTIPIDPRTGTPTGPAQRVSVGGGDSPSFSPDGKLIAFAVEEPSPRTKNDLAVVPATGGPERVLANYDKFINQTYWSADGRWIFVQSGERQSIERVPAAGGPSEIVISNSGEVEGSIRGQIAFYRPDACAQAEGRMAYVTASGERGEFRIPPGSHSQSLWSAQTLLTHSVGGVPTSTIYELDMRPILRAIGKP